jgi:bifunctional UDP-N-acetylglucosamine pyrophosphorylase/glucosamine-1-phosphate N-acetyltransferase/UDP-N-acetylglucosamine pyrophosphorylase
LNHALLPYPFHEKSSVNPMGKKIAVVMAAGKGTRMKSELPKVLFPVCGRPMIEYVVDALTAGGIDQIVVVVGYRAELVKKQLAGCDRVVFALQAEQLGTGHAVLSAKEYLEGHDGAVVVVAGDSPMMQSRSIVKLLAEFDRNPVACLLGTAHKDNPAGLGRILRDERGDFVGIVEEKDATPEQRQVTEVNMSYYVFRGPDLLESLQHLRADNAQKEYYVTDCPGILMKSGKKVRALAVLDPRESMSINTIDELSAVEAAMEQVG